MDNLGQGEESYESEDDDDYRPSGSSVGENDNVESDSSGEKQAKEEAKKVQELADGKSRKRRKLSSRRTRNKRVRHVPLISHSSDSDYDETSNSTSEHPMTTASEDGGAAHHNYENVDDLWSAFLTEVGKVGSNRRDHVTLDCMDGQPTSSSSCLLVGNGQVPTTPASEAASGGSLAWTSTTTVIATCSSSTPVLAITSDSAQSSLVGKDPPGTPVLSISSSGLTAAQLSTLKSAKSPTEEQSYHFAGEVVNVGKDSSGCDLNAGGKSLICDISGGDGKSTPGSLPITNLKGKSTSSKLSDILTNIGGKKKLSTLEKSRLDWNSFKTKEGIGEELTSHNRGKDGFLEKQAFLERADVRQFEREREARLSRR